jgi:hypothetical protein
MTSREPMTTAAIKPGRRLGPGFGDLTAKGSATTASSCCCVRAVTSGGLQVIESGVSPLIVRQWTARRLPLTGTDEQADHDRVVATVIRRVRVALQPAVGTDDQRRAGDRRLGVRHVVELGQQVAALVGEVARDRLLVVPQQRDRPAATAQDGCVEPAALADADQDQGRSPSSRAPRLARWWTRSSRR